MVNWSVISVSQIGCTGYRPVELKFSNENATSTGCELLPVTGRLRINEEIGEF
jgi:hypothetical protein